ncbi:MAG: hypothetical protein U0Q03_23595 [Acidimicrobiales bacterium]
MTASSKNVRPTKGSTPLPAYLQTSLPADATAVDQLAFEILSGRRDLLPSVQRIIDAGGEGGGERALRLFCDALDVIGDPNRDPRVAIANAASQAGDAG